MKMKIGDGAILRKHLIELLKSGGAHANFEAAVGGIPPEVCGQRPSGGDHSPWELLEHMRIAQWDILEFVRNPKHVSPDFPAGYWPQNQSPGSAADWEKSVKAFLADLRSFSELIANESTDLFAPLPHGSGEPILQKVLLAADHTAYHLGQLVQARRMLGAWR